MCPRSRSIAGCTASVRYQTAWGCFALRVTLEISICASKTSNFPGQKNEKKKSRRRESEACSHVIFSSLPTAWLSMVLRSDSHLTQVVFSICGLLQEVRAGRLQDHTDHLEDHTLNPSMHPGFSVLLACCSFSVAEKLKEQFFLFIILQKCFFIRSWKQTVNYWWTEGANIVHIEDQGCRWPWSRWDLPFKLRLLCEIESWPGVLLVPCHMVYIPVVTSHLRRFRPECKAALSLCNLKVWIFLFHFWYQTSWTLW